MIKNWTQFIGEFIDHSKIDIIDVKMNEFRDLINNVSDGQNILYEWENINNHQLLINFTIDDKSIRYEFDIDHLILRKISDNRVKFQKKVDTLDEGLEIIEKDIHKILDINVRIDRNEDNDVNFLGERAKSVIYKGYKIPGKYLTKNPGKMKKEIHKFRGKRIYKGDWDADYVSGKGGVGERIKTKKSEATKAYERMFKKK